ncbi:MAG TPA: [Fe-Fe] hydrogenase large subunit C-terminal domain-containing protein [Candidatus Dojkabacteria bacterium]|nr:[Fe-Fe] hydrogenase large subunit C-terminal domain-containing protein [Candidatus Dojkabacteria bacterium]HQF37348.1 [Fe-Fe] hydrogenase large subunit C-terminal domain-containing protein [Candidatus Dojkabacteria bacterium]
MEILQKLDELLHSNSKSIALVAPSFVADFEYPQFINQLRHLGFDKIVELTFGAKLVNLSYYQIIKDNKEKTWISSPCPTVVQLIKRQFPHLIDNLVPVHSPMGVMSQICKKFFPNHKQVFIGPCITKKTEAIEIGGIELALTFKEINQYILEKNPSNVSDNDHTFDKFYNDYTKIYPLSGGLSHTLKYNQILNDDQILIMEGLKELSEVFSQFKDGKHKNYVLLDVLACQGGCIGGPGMVGNSDLQARKEKVLKYRQWASNNEKNLGRTGKKVHAEGIDPSRKFVNNNTI